MVFNSLAFLAFFPIVCLVYYLIPSLRWKNLFLLAASYYFYMSWQPVYALLLLSSTLITWGASLAIEKDARRKRLWLILAIVLNLGILFFFKYFNWAAENVAAVASAMGLTMQVPNLDVLLPVGISFYTFQALGYAIDVYRGDVKAERDVLTYALFVAFFPQLVAGPIERSGNLLPQFKTRHTFEGDRAIKGMLLMLWGFFLKIVIANNLANYVDDVYDNLPEQSGWNILSASIFFCIQLYGDFAGYSYIAIGAARIMGFHLMDNFLRPYFFSATVQEYWRRNHISLTTWLMDYIYYPMVGSSISKAWWCCCIFLTFFISGFWHGANWTYVMSFSIFGLYLVVCILKDKRQKKFERKHGLKNAAWWIWTNRAVTFFLVMIALVFFRANTLSDGFYALTHLVPGMTGGAVNRSLFHFLLILMVFGVEYCVEYKKAAAFIQRHFLLSYTVMSLVLSLVMLWLGEFTGGQFIYFQF